MSSEEGSAGPIDYFDRQQGEGTAEGDDRKTSVYLHSKPGFPADAGRPEGRTVYQFLGREGRSVGGEVL